MSSSPWFPHAPSQRRVPMTMQDEMSECGLACLAMVAAYHGLRVDLAQLRRRFPSSVRGVSLARVMELAHTLGLNARALRVELQDLPTLNLPCIVHWDLDHFVVLTGVRKGVVTLHDPARGVRRLSMAEIDRHLTGVVLELDPGADFQRADQRQPLPWRSLLGHTRGWAQVALQMLAVAIALEFFTLLVPFALQWVMDEVLVSADLDLLNLITIGFLAVVGLQSATTALRGLAISALGGSLNAQWTQQLFGHLMRLPMAFFERRQIGEVLSRFFSLQSIQQTLTGSFVESVMDGLTAMLVLVLLLGLDARLATLISAGVGIYAATRWLGYRRLRLLKEEQLAHTARQQSLLLESVYAVQTIKLANAEADRQARLGNATIAMLNRDVAVQRIGFAFSALQQWMFGSARIVLIALGARKVLAGEFSVGVLVTFLVFCDLFVARTARMIDKLVELALLGLNVERIADIALSAPEIVAGGIYSGPQPRATLEFERVSFRYSDADPWILRNLSFSVPAHQALAIVGPSGCGKSTLAKLLLGLLPPTEGRILIDGIDIHHFGLRGYRALFGSVMQNDRLLAGSIADNISFFDSAATLERIAEAARIASIDQEIGAMPMGYETPIGEMGTALSGGQTQRLLLARALYRQAPLLLLDEATSHLDVPRERLVNAEIAALRCTRILIAHRPETIASADAVLVLEAGCGAVMSPQQYLPALQSRIRLEPSAFPRGGP